MRGGKSLDEIEKIIRSEDFPKSFIESRGLEVHKIYGVRYDPNFPMGNSFKFNLSYFEGNYEEKGEAELKAFFEAHSKLGDSLLFTGERRENKFVIDGIFDKDQNNFFNTYLFEHPPKLKRED
ncbi:hypothetical protein HYT57_04030 [Candidatus Woesearchaeota archaeon]|nr:hypothetical protein [Candidatus Woesearchaeota archaeon]